MSTRDVNFPLFSTVPEDTQQQTFVNLTQGFYNGDPFKPKSAEEISLELAESRDYYERGEYEDFDDALDDISRKYSL